MDIKCDGLSFEILEEGVEAKAVNSAGFIAAIRERLEKRLG